MNTSRGAAIVTGGSGGIGRAIVTRLANDGFPVVVNYSGDAAKADELVKTLVSSGALAIAVKGDVSNEADVAALFSKAASQFGAIDIVVNCAGTMPLSPIAKGDVGVFDQVIATNLRGTFLVLSQAAQHVASGGRIIVFSSSVVAKSFPGYGPYIAAKEGVEGLMRVLANELRGKNISVNAVAPGPVRTELFLKGKTDEQITQTAKAAPMERLGEPDDIAHVVSFLAGPDGSWVNAQVLRANGGFA